MAKNIAISLWYLKRLVTTAKLSTLVILTAFCSVYGFMLFDKYESTWFPVVEEFQITSAYYDGNSVVIQGNMKKSERQCEFLEVVAYDISKKNQPKLMNVSFLDTPGTSYTRIPGYQLWGPWQLIPKSNSIRLVAHHSCITGRVSTRIFEGVLVLSGGDSNTIQYN